MIKPISAVTFIEKCIRKNELGQTFKLLPFQKEILELAFAFDQNGKLAYDTVLFSTIKKSGAYSAQIGHPIRSKAAG